MTEQLDSQGEAREALSSMVTDYSKRVLSDPRMLGNLVTDLLPDLPRERSLLVTAAESDIAGDLTRHVEEHHLDPDTAVQLVARSLTDRRALDPAASTWVTTEYAEALGYHLRSGGAPPQPGPPPAAPPAAAPPTAEHTVTTYAPQGYTAPPQGPAPGSPGGYPGYTQPPGQPPVRPPTRRNRWPVFAAAGTAAVVVIFAIAAFAGGLFSSPKPTPTPSPAFVHTTTHPVTPSPRPTTGVASLTELLPGDIDDPASECSAHTPKFALTGEVQGLLCNDPGLPNGSVEAYQMNSYASYLKSWDSFNKWWGFTSYTPGSACPPAGSDHLTAEGTTTWYDKYFPQRRGQVFECEWTGTGNNPSDPAIVWTFPTENAFIIAWGGNNTAFSALQTWWTNNVLPLASPTPVAPSP